MQVKIKKLTKTAKVPTRKSEMAAGYDLYADINEAIAISPHVSVKIGTGIAIALPKGYFGAIFARSGLATNNGLRPANCVGCCDADYRGEYTVAIHNDSDYIQFISPGDRIAQLVIMEYQDIEYCVVDELDETERGDGGFGSTGQN